MEEQHLYLTRDIAAILTSVDVAIRNAMAANGGGTAYYAGARDALAAVALAIRIEPGRVLPQIEEPRRTPRSSPR